MKTKDLSKMYGFDQNHFDEYLRLSSFSFKSKLLGNEVNDEDVTTIVNEYKEYLANQDAENLAKQQAIASMLITSGFSFEGYTIKKYSGYISGDDAVEIPRETQGFFGGRYNTAGDGLMAALVEIRRNALGELKEAAYALGCNAVIGVDFDYITLDPETASNTGGTLYLPYIIGVTANGNAVVIEKDEE